MRWIRKIVIVGLAAFGAYRLYELARPKAEELRAKTTPPLSDAVDSMKSAAAQMKDDVTSAATQAKIDLTDDIKIAADDQQSKLATAAQEARKALDGEPADSPAGTT